MDQVPRSSVFSRKIVNLFAGMAFGSPDLPRIFKDGGYYCHSIEQGFSVGPAQIVNPEVVLCSDQDGHTLIVEAKSGANLKPEQLLRYTLVSSEHLKKSAFASTAASQKHDVLIIGLSQWQQRLEMGSSQIPCARRVLAVADPPLPALEGEDISMIQPFGGIKRIENAFETDRLNEGFNPTLDIDWDLIPNNFLPVDHESADWEFAEVMIPELIARILNGEKELNLSQIAESFIRHWPVIGGKYRKRLLDRMRYLVRLAAQKQFSSFITIGIKEMGRDEIRLSIPQELATKASNLRSQLQKKFKEFMDDLNSPQIAMLYEE